MAKKILIQVFGFFLIPYAYGQNRVVVNDGLGTVIGGRSAASLEFDMHATETISNKISVNIRCRNDQTQGLVCSADYADRCKEQWNFPNPCTQYNIDMNVTKFVHPYDKTRFLMCGQLGKLYIVQCPQYEVFSERCGQCVGQDAGLIGSCSELPLPPLQNNPCTREAILQNKLFFPFHGNLSRFIHCDIWGKPWERICTPGEVWSVWDVTCVLPHLLNPCNRPTTEVNYLYGHPCDPAKYLTCDIQGRAHEINCARGEAFHETNQRCRPYKDFKDRLLSSYCEHYVFGFRQYRGNERGGFGVSEGAISGLTGQGFQRDNAGLNIDRTIRKVDGTVVITRDTSGQGLNANLDLRGGSLNRETNLQGQGGGTAAFDRTTQVRGGSLSGQINTDGQGHFDGRLDVKRGSISGGSSGVIGQGSLDQGFNGGAATNFVDIRDKSLSSGLGTAEFVDIRNAGTSRNSANMIDIRGQKGSGTVGMEDIRRRNSVGGIGVSGGMSDIRKAATGSGGVGMVDIRTGQTSGTVNMLDIREGTGGNAMDISGSGTGVSGRMADIRRQGTGGIDMVDIRTGQTIDTRKMSDIRRGIDGNGVGVSGSGTGISGSMTDIRRQGSGTGSMETVDIRTGTRKMSDIRFGIDGNGMDISGSGTGVSGSMTDIRPQGSGTGSMDMVDIRTGTRKMSDIRFGIDGNRMDISGSGTGVSGSMTDIRRKGSGTGSMGTVDIRTGQTTGTRKLSDIRGGTIANDIGVSGSGTGVSGIMTDIRNQGSSGNQMVDIRKGQTTGTGNIAAITGLEPGTLNGGAVDSTGQLSSGFADIRVTRTEIGTTGDMTGIRDMADIHGGKRSIDISGDVSGGMADIRGRGTGSIGGSDMTDIRGGSISSGFLDVRSSNTGSGINGGITGSGMEDIRTPITGTLDKGMEDIRRQGIGSKGVGLVDIRYRNSGVGMVDVRGPNTGNLDRGMTDIRTQSSGSTGLGIVDTSGGAIVGVRGSNSGTLNGGMGDIIDQGRGTSKSGFTDIRRFRTDVSGMEDIRNIGSRGVGTVDIGGAKNSLSSNFVDINKGVSDGGFVDISGTQNAVRGSTVDMSVQGSGTGSGNMIDIRGGKASRTNSMVDIRGGSSGGRLIDIRGSNRERAGGMADITGGSTGNGMADIRGASGSRTTIDIRGARQGTLDGTGVGIVDSVTGQDQGSRIDVSRQGLSQTSTDQLTGIVRNQQNQGSVTMGNQNGIGSITSFDLRNQLGLNGQASTANVDSTGRMNTDSIRFRGSVQGGGRQGGGSMNELLNTWNQIVEAGSTVTGQGTISQAGMSQTGQMFDRSTTIHPSRLGLYELSSGYFVPPCTRKNIDEGRTHFRHKGFPHEFIQCDQSGKMHRMECAKTDWFDVYTNTCVDGPVHVDNQVQ